MNPESGQRVKAWREGRGLTQRELAEALGYKQSYIGNIEAGRSEPSRNFLDRLSQKFAVNAEWVLQGSGAAVGSYDPALLLICGGAVARVFADLGVPLTKETHYREGMWFMNELLARMKDPEDGDEMEALMPQIRAMLTQRIAASEN